MQKIKFFKSISNSDISLSFFLIWNGIFRPKRRKNPTLLGGTYLYTLYKVVTPPPGSAATQATFDTDEKSLFGFSLRCRWKYVTPSFEEFWLDIYASSHGGSIWSDMSAEILWIQVTCISCHTNINQHWINHWQSFLFSSGYVSDVFTK